MNLTALKIAVREARASRGKFLFVILAVAAGVGALTGVRGFSQSFAALLLRDARALMAADLSVRLFSEPVAEQHAVIRSLERRSAETTRVTETLSMVSSTAVPQPLLVSVKAVDPQVFPFYGEVKLAPQGKLSQVLNPSSAVISEDLRIRLRANTGDTLRIGGSDFRVAGIVTAEPDRMSGSFNVGPRLMISREGLDRTGLIGLGSRASQRILFRLGKDSPNVATVREELKRVFPEGMIVDFRETNPNIARGLDRATTFLSLVSLIAVVVGAIGVGTSMHAHLQGKMDSIAIMKSLGGRSNQVIRIYIIQTAMLGLLGGLAGVVVGSGVQTLFPFFIERYFQARPDIVFTPESAVQGLLIGLFTTLLFTLPPLLTIRHVKPGLIFRRDMPEVKPSLRRRALNYLPSLGAGALICIGVGAVAAWLAGGNRGDAARLGAFFVGGVLAGVVVLTAIASLLLWFLRMVVQRGRLPIPITLRHAMANLYRPGSQARAVLVALGIGVMFTLTVYLVQTSVIGEMARSAPPGMANVFLIDITQDQRAELEKLIRASTGLEREPEFIATVSARLVALSGVPMEQVALPRVGGRFRATRAIATDIALPAGTQVVRGQWWTAANANEPLVSVSEGTARNLKVEPGSTLTWNAFGRTLITRVASVHRNDQFRLRAMMDFIVSPGAMQGLPTTHYAGVRIKSPDIALLQRAVYERFPTVTVINVADILDRVQEVVNQVSVVVRFISAFSIFAGAIILASSVAGTRFRRIREVVIFKTLGATRSRIAKMFSAEFLILGTVAGLMGSLLATGFSNLLLQRFFQADPRVDLLPNAVAILATASVAAASGWLASFRILGQKPLEVLRGE